MDAAAHRLWENRSNHQMSAAVAIAAAVTYATISVDPDAEFLPDPSGCGMSGSVGSFRSEIPILNCRSCGESGHVSSFRYLPASQRDTIVN
mmetsp:Transcript_89944/g.262883  ORF Transcript_89944/g.262883 Transcript_89944/m.262883 type:complete len:91 (-) Transcript_89944:947-1219(-)